MLITGDDIGTLCKIQKNLCLAIYLLFLISCVQNVQISSWCPTTLKHVGLIEYFYHLFLECYNSTEPKMQGIKAILLLLLDLTHETSK